MNRYFYFGIFLLLAGLNFSCSGTKKLVKPMEQYEEFLRERRSVISIPIELGVKELERSLNAQLNGVVYEDTDMRSDNMAITATKNQAIEISVDSSEIRYRVPLDLLVKYDAGFTELQGRGEIAINLVTRFDIKANWAFETQTDIVDHEWLRKPKVSMAGISIPIGFVADLILKNTRGTLARSIDNMVAQNFELDKLISKTWEQMYQPILVAPEYNTWLVVNPDDIGLTPIYMEDDSLQTTIIIEGQPTIVIGDKPGNVDPAPLPLFTRKPDLFDGFMINIGAQISYEEAERLAKDQIIGEKYTYGKRSVTVEDLEIYGRGDQVIVNTQLSGSYTGNIYLQGRPSYNRRKNTIELKNLDFTLDTRNFLFKSAGWLLKGPIKKNIENNMNFLLSANLEDSQAMLQKQLDEYKIAPGIKLDANVNDLSIRDVLVIREGLYADIFLSGDLKVVVDRLDLKK